MINLQIILILLIIILVIILALIIKYNKKIKLNQKELLIKEFKNKIHGQCEKNKITKEKIDKKSNIKEIKNDKMIDLTKYIKTIKTFDNKEYKIIDINEKELLDLSRKDNQLNHTKYQLVKKFNENKLDFPWKKIYLKEPKWYFKNLVDYAKKINNNPMTVIDIKEIKPHNIRFNAKDNRNNLLFPLDYSRGWSLLKSKLDFNNSEFLKSVDFKNFNGLTLIDDEKNYETMDVITDLFQEQERLKARRSDQEKSPLEFWIAGANLDEKSSKNIANLDNNLSKNMDNKVRETIEKTIEKYNKINPESLRETYYTLVREATLFKPTLVVDIIELFGKGSKTRYLDMSAGWGDRLIGAIASDVEYYLAYDPNTNLKEGHQKMINMFVPENKRKNYCIKYEGFENFSNDLRSLEKDSDSKSEKNNKFNLIFTSPPFFDFEIYTKENGQSVDRYSTLPDWMVNFLINNIKNAWEALNDEGYCIIHITDVYKTQVCEPMCLLIQAEIPTAYYCGVINSVGAAGKPRPMWVFQKQDNYANTNEQQYRQRRSKTALQYLFKDINSEYQNINNNEYKNKLDEVDGNDENKILNDINIIQKELNPPIEIENISISDNENISISGNENKKEIKGDNIPLHVIRDDNLTGGTKQRALALYINKFPKTTEFLYISPPNGYAQIALAYIAKLLGKKATIVVSKQPKRTNLTQKAYEFGANIMEKSKPNTMKDLKPYAQAYVDKLNRKYNSNYIKIMPFGLDDPTYMKLLEDAIKEQLPQNMIDNPPKRMWLVAGSGTILRVLHNIFPDTFFNIVQVGKPIWDDILEQITDSNNKPNYKLYIAPEKFWEEAKEQPPYPTVATYDAKLWQFVLQDAKPNDYIWNVGKDI